MNLQLDLGRVDHPPATQDQSSQSDEFFTPREILDWLPPIGFDPCHNAASNVVARQTYDIRRGENSMKLPWLECEPGEIVWLNPPYSNCSEWIALARHWANRLPTPIVCLIPAKPGEVYWHEHIWSRPGYVAFLRGRVAFDTVAGKGKECGTFGSALVVMGNIENMRSFFATQHIRAKSRGSKWDPKFVR